MTNQAEAPGVKAKRHLTKAEIETRIREAGERARAEADARRAKQAEEKGGHPKEIGGPKGPEPTRYGDWERNGIASDF
jgi:hypothetical protein